MNDLALSLAVVLTVALPVVILVHEVGHVVAATLMRQRIHRLRLYGPPWLWDRRRPLTWLQLGTNPLSVSRVWHDHSQSRWANSFVLAAGLLAQFGLGALLAFLLWSGVLPSRGAVTAVAVALAATAIVHGLISLVPSGRNDVARIIRLWRSEQRPREAPATANLSAEFQGRVAAAIEAGDYRVARDLFGQLDQATREHPAMRWIDAGLAHGCGDLDDAVELCELLEAHCEQHPAPTIELDELRDLHAHSLLRRDQPGDAAAALAMTRRLVRGRRDPLLLGTHGSALIATGRVEEGSRVLRSIRDQLPDFGQDIVDCWLALAAALHGAAPNARATLDRVAAKPFTAPDAAAVQRRLDRLTSPRS